MPLPDIVPPFERPLLAIHRLTRVAMNLLTLLAVAVSTVAGVLALSPGLGAAQAQVSGLRGAEATLDGRVRTQSGLPLGGVQVRFEPRAGEVIQRERGTETTTDLLGRFTLSIPAATEGLLTITREGGLVETLRVSPLAAGERRDLAINLLPLYRLDAVTVVRGRERPILNTEDAATGGSLEAVELAALPSESRDPYRLAFSIPGVSQATAYFGDAPLLTLLGDNALYTQYTVDGLDNNEGFLGGPRVALPLSAIRRLDVQVAGYGPALGRSPNGIVNLETRTGGEGGDDLWFGELFVVGRPGTPLDASPKFAPPGVDPDGFRRFQIGGGIGGAIRPGQTYVFTAVEYTDEREDRIGSTARTAFLGTELRTTAKVFARLDHGWTPEQTTTVRFASSELSRKGQGGGVIVPEADITTIRHGTLASLTHRSGLGGGRGANTFSAQFGTFRWDFPPSESDLSTPQVTIVSPDLTTIEAIVGSSNFIFDERERQVQLQNLVELRLRPGHTLRVGADVVHARFELLGANTNPRGAYTVVNDGNIMPRAFGPNRPVSIYDIPKNVRVLRYSIDARPQQVNLSQTLVGSFVEYLWRPRTDLSLRGGVRWDYDDLTSRGESAPDLDNVQPRLSVNWLPTSRTSLRAGAGIYTGTFPYAIYSDAVQFGPDGNAVVTFEGSAFPPPRFLEGPSAADIEALAGALPPREVRRMFARGLEQPEARQITLGWGRELGAGGVWGLALDGVWVEARNLPRSWDLNPLDRPLTAADTVNLPAEAGDPLRPVNPATSGIRRLTTTDSGGRSSHLGAHLSLRRSPVDGFGLEGRWSVTRTRNDTEDLNFHATQGNNFAAEWADAVNDRRHHLTLRSFWSPGSAGKRSGLTVGAVADFQTGTPINRIAYFRDLDGSGSIFGNGFLGNHDRFAGVPRNGERLPSAFRVDGSVEYGMALWGGILNLRVEGFNLLNESLKSGFANGIPGGGPRTQVGRPGDPIVYTTAAPPRQFQLSGRWHF
jgi:hypothetical protein